MPVKAEPIFTCDTCGVELSGDTLLGYSLTCLNPGHGAIASFGCEDRQHFACCTEHARQQILDCFEELEATRLLKIKELELK